MPDFKPGDRVYVTDPSLARLREIMCSFGEVPQPNHHGTVNEVHDDHILIYFDSEEGPGQGSSAPYPPHEVRHLTEGTTDA